MTVVHSAGSRFAFGFGYTYLIELTIEWIYFLLWTPTSIELYDSLESTYGSIGGIHNCLIKLLRFVLLSLLHDSDGRSVGTWRWLKVYAADQGRFFTDFAAAYTKLVNTGARWGPSMQV